MPFLNANTAGTSPSYRAQGPVAADSRGPPEAATAPRLRGGPGAEARRAEAGAAPLLPPPSPPSPQDGTLPVLPGPPRLLAPPGSPFQRGARPPCSRSLLLSAEAARCPRLVARHGCPSPQLYLKMSQRGGCCRGRGETGAAASDGNVGTRRQRKGNLEAFGVLATSVVVWEGWKRGHDIDTDGHTRRKVMTHTQKKVKARVIFSSETSALSVTG